jgi:co-chaperonin GroES (HSP10)
MHTTNNRAAAATTSDTLEPLHDYVLVRIMPKGETAGGIALPDVEGSSVTERGLVLKVGPGYINELGNLVPVEVKPGDVVYLPPNPVHLPVPIQCGRETLWAIRYRALAVCQTA